MSLYMFLQENRVTSPWLHHYHRMYTVEFMPSDSQMEKCVQSEFNTDDGKELKQVTFEKPLAHQNSGFLNSIIKYFQEYSRSSSLHGLQYVGEERRHRFERYKT